MFVRIIKGTHESLYECRRYHVTPQDEDGFLLTIEHGMAGYDGLSIFVDKTVPEKLEVYVMNDQGQTVDRMFMKAADDEAMPTQIKGRDSISQKWNQCG